MMKKHRLLTFLVAAAALLVLPLLLQQGGNAWVRIVDMALLYVLLALGLNIVVGYAGLLDLGDKSRVADIPASLVKSVFDRAARMLEESIDRMKTDAAEVPLLAVGGGAFIVPERLAGVGQVLRPPHAHVANAVGAAIAQVSGETDQVFQGLSRQEAMDQAERIARDRAVAAGADAATLALVDIEDLPLSYMPGGALRVRARVVGDIAA